MLDLAALGTKLFIYLLFRKCLQVYRSYYYIAEERGKDKIERREEQKERQMDIKLEKEYKW